MTAPINCRWTGEAFEPLRHFRAECDATFVVGQVYRLEEVKDRSLATHNHEFAWLAEAWRNLPENISEAYPTVEHLRKRALIDAGYFNETITDAGNNAAAIRVASLLRAIDDFSLVIVRKSFVIRRTAKSQSRRAMNAKEFQQSKTDLLETVSALLGATPAEAERSRMVA